MPPTLGENAKDSQCHIIHRFEAIKYYVGAMAEAIEGKHPHLADLRANPPEPKKAKKKGAAGQKKGAAGRGRGRGGRGRGGRGRGVGQHPLLLPVVPGLPNLAGTDTDDAEDGDGDSDTESKRGRPPLSWVGIVDKLGASTPPFKRHVRTIKTSPFHIRRCPTR
jgi:hypothetical protein